MRQVIKKNKKVKNKVAAKHTKKKPLYGTSKLEDRFAKEFLDKLGVKYTRQLEAKDIGRFYDFAVFLKHGGMVLIEIDGGYW